MTQQKAFTVATAGHVDHGKTSLLKALTGIDPDRLKEEKERQMTTDLGFAHLSLPEQITVGFIDVPGHGKFLKNMLAGVGGIDLALLVVAADEGPMPQTQQHCKILSLLGVRRILLAITKIDLAPPSQIQFVQEGVAALVERLGMELIASVEISNTKNIGFETLREKLLCGLKNMPLRDRNAALYLPIDRVFNKAGFGLVVTGTLVNGSLAVGQQVVIEPGGCSARVRRLETFGQKVEAVSAGQRVAGNLVMKDAINLARGHSILDKAARPVQLLICSLSGLEDRIHDLSGLAGQPVRLYHGTAECHGQIRWIESAIDIEQVPSKLPVESVAQIFLSDAVVANVGDRFVIRLSDDSICGGGIIIKDPPRWLGRKTIQLLLADLLRADYQSAVSNYLERCPRQIVKLDDLEKFMPDRSRKFLLDGMIGDGKLVRLGPFFLSAKFKRALTEQILQKLADVAASRHRDLSLEHLRAGTKPILERSAFQELIQELIDKSEITRDGDKIALANRGNCIPESTDNSQLESRLIDVLSNHWCLELDELARLCNIQPEELKLVLREIVQAGKIAVVNYEFAACAARLEKAHQKLAELWQEKRDISPSDFRDRLGTTRKYAMALLAYFDDQKITRRLQTGRVLLRQPK